jgi:hypothetical protein
VLQLRWGGDEVVDRNRLMLDMEAVNGGGVHFDGVGVDKRPLK